jgi:signal transduction histidine kinase/streptogramin lyase
VKYGLLHQQSEMNKPALICLTFLLLLMLSANGQGLGRYRFEEFDLAHKAGVPGVYSMFQDTKGVIWLGSTNGIYRYDGSRIFEFDAEQKKVLGKTNYAFLKSKNGDVVIGSDFGICTFNIRENKVKLIVTLNRVFHNRSRFYPLCFDEEGNLWFMASRKGIGYYDGRKVYWVQNPPSIPPESIDKLSDAFFDSKSGNVYLSNYYGSFSAIFNVKTRGFSFDNLQTTTTFKLRDNVLYRIKLDSIHTTNLLTGEQKAFGVSMRKELANNFLYSKSVIVDDEWIWISLLDGILPFNYRNQTFGQLFGYGNDTKSPLLRHVSELFKDKEGNIWVCTETNGIRVLNQFQLKRFQCLRDFGSSNNIIMDIEPVNDSLLLVCPLVEAPQLVNVFTNGHKNLFAESSAQKGSYNAMKVDMKHILVSKLDGESFLLNTSTLKLKKLELQGVVFGKAIKSSQPNTFFIYNGSELKMYKFENEGFTFLKSLLLGFSSESIIYNPYSNEIHIGGQEKSLVIDGGTLTKTSEQKPVFGAFMDCFWNKDKTLWLATRSGLFHYDIKNQLIESFNTTNGLNNDVVYAIQPNSDSSKLYLSTNLGISCFTFATKTFQNFTLADGLSESEHNGTASATDGKGNYYFGNIKGITIFNELFDTRIAYKLFLIVQGIYIDDTIYNKHVNPDFINSIDVYPKNTAFGINFSLLSTSEPEKLIYSYKIEGIDTKFHQSNSATAIRISKPRPGTYTIVLRGEIDGGLFVEKRIKLIVHAPFYLKWWFLIPGILLFHIIVFLIIRRIIRNRVSKKQKEIENERRFFEQKSQIARELHDNVGARLSMMLNTVDWIGKKPVIELSDLNEIKENTKVVIQGLRDAIWVMDKTQITTEELFDKIKYYTNQIIRSYPVRPVFNEVIHKPIFLNTTQALNLFRIVQESLNNALKYASATQIEVTLSYEGDTGISIEIQDNGVGFDTQNAIRGHGLKNMQTRATEINADFNLQSLVNEGTIIKITLYIV